MGLPIIERPLYGEILIETAPWATPFVWTNQTANLVNGVNYSIGGRVGQPGSSSVDSGTLNATFKNMSTIPNVGALVRISFSKVAGYAFVGYVQDVSQRIVFDDSISYTTPITLTTLNCLDWVGYVSQLQVVGAGGANATTGATLDGSSYLFTSRVAALNKIVDPTYSTKLITATNAGGTNDLGDTDLVGTISNHLDLITNTVRTFWYPNVVLPTNVTTGRTGLVDIRSTSLALSTGKTFTDVAGTAGQLHYTEIDFENSSQNVANTIVLNNRARFYASEQEATIVGGFNETNYVVINNENISGIAIDSTQYFSDASSISTYGVRQTQIESNASVSYARTFNFISNPSAEYSDEGYSGDGNIRVRRRKPSEDDNPFTAYNGSWAIRSRQRVANNAAVVTYSGGESDGIPVLPGFSYYLNGRAARGSVSRTDVRIIMQINWYDENESLISTIGSGSLVTLTTANTWYSNDVTGTAPAGAVRATVSVRFTRPGALLNQVGDRLWVDALKLSRGDGVGNTEYFDGDTPYTDQWGYAWTGGVGLSQSVRFNNYTDTVGANFLADHATTSNRVTRIRWNAQENLTATPSLRVGYTISLVYKGTTTTYRIVGIDGNIDPERYMIDYYLTKV